MLRQSLYVISFLISLSAQAREVSITMDENQTSLVIANPSSVSVTYNIVCQKSDGSGTTLNASGQTLAAGARTTHNTSIPDSGLCASSAAPVATGTDTNGKAFYYCSGSNAYAAANNACGTGNVFCNPSLISSYSQSSGSGFWLKNDGSLDHRPDFCTSYSTISVGNPNQVTVGMGSLPTGMAARTGSVCGYFSYADLVSTSTAAGAICCASPVVGSVCKITISGSNSNAYLSSPSFMGGAAF